MRARTLRAYFFASTFLCGLATRVIAEGIGHRNPGALKSVGKKGRKLYY